MDHIRQNTVGYLITPPPLLRPGLELESSEAQTCTLLASHGGLHFLAILWLGTKGKNHERKKAKKRLLSVTQTPSLSSYIGLPPPPSFTGAVKSHKTCPQAREETLSNTHTFMEEVFFALLEEHRG